MIKKSICVAGTFVAVIAFADTDPYADYVKLKVSEWATTAKSWNAPGNWSDGLAPDPSKNYYIPKGIQFWKKSPTNTNFADDFAENTWGGGKLVIAGTFHISTTRTDGSSPLIKDLVLLGGCNLRAECYGPFYPRNNTTGIVTVAGTVDAPAVLSHHYSESRTSTGYVRRHTLYAYFMGTKDSALVYTRPFTNYQPKAIDNGFFAVAPNFTFSQYPGNLIVRGGNTTFKPDSGNTYNWPLTALTIDDGARCYFHENLSYYANNKAAYLRSLNLASGGKMFVNTKVNSAVSQEAYPIVNVTENFSNDGTGKILFSSLDLQTLPGVSAENPDGKIMQIAHLAGAAAETYNGASHANFGYAKTEEIEKGFKLIAETNEDGSKDLFLAMPNVVMMTNMNVESTGYPAGSVQYSAFQKGHAGDWSNNETPEPDSKMHYWATQRLCFFSDVVMPDATLTLAKNSSWKDGTYVQFKEINFFPGVSFGMWASKRLRYLTAERINFCKKDDDTPSNAVIYIGQGFSLLIDAELCGDNGVTFQNMNNQKCTIAMPGINTNFHGKMMFSQSSNLATQTEYQVTMVLADARNWGGKCTDTNTFDAIKFTKFPSVHITNNVEFAEPTRGMYVHQGVQFDIDNGKTMKLSNTVTYEGSIRKIGLGTLDLAGESRFFDGKAETAPAATSNVIHVANGALKISSDNAANGLSLIFDEGTKLVIPSNSNSGYYNVKWNNPLAVYTQNGKLPVEIEIVGEITETNIDVPICTFNEAAAVNIPTSLFSIGKLSNGYYVKKIEKVTNNNGEIVYMARAGLVGTQVIIR